MDCVFLVFLVVGATKGVKKGVLGGIARFIVFVLAGIAAYYVSTKIVDLWLCESEIGIWFENQISSLVKNVCGNVETKEDLLIFLQSKNNIIALIMTKLIEGLEIMSKESFFDYFSKKIAVVIEKVLVFAIIFLIMYIFLRKITKLAGKISNISAASAIDKMLGVLLGIVKAAIVFGIFYLGVGVLSNMVHNHILTILMQNDKIVSVIYNFVYEKTISVFLPY